MTAPSPMSREELLELAALDALSLLDEYEAALFTRSFHHAPTAVQDEIKELQAAFATDDSLLPDVEPSAELRTRVLGSMSRAIESESVKLAPLATIGRPRIERRSTTSAPRASLTSSGQFWRAASFVLVGVLVALVVIGTQRRASDDKFHSWVVDLFAQEQARFAQAEVGRILEEEAADDIVGRDLMEFAQAPTRQTATMKSTSPTASAVAVVLFDPKSEDAFVLSIGLPTHTSYTLTAHDGTETITQTFTPIRAMHGMVLPKISGAMFASMTWTVKDTKTGRVVLKRA